jgi:hypothetical protein
MTIAINGIEYPDELAPDAQELHELAHAYLSCLMENGTPGEMHADLLGEYYSTLPQRFKRVMAFQIARRERMAWEAEHANVTPIRKHDQD